MVLHLSIYFRCNLIITLLNIWFINFLIQLYADTWPLQASLFKTLIQALDIPRMRTTAG